MSQKGSVLPVILIMLLVAAAAFLIYRYQKPTQSMPAATQVSVSGKPLVQIPKPAPTVKTYQDNQLNFQFEYPPVGFEVAPDGEENYFKITATDHRKNFAGYIGFKPPVFVKGLMLIKPGENIQPDYASVPFALWVFDNPDKLSIDAWFDKYWYYPFVWGIFSHPSKNTITPTNEATISGKAAKSAIVSYQPGKPEFVYIDKGDKMFMFRLIEEGKDQVVNRILQTFKFTK